MTGRKPKQKGDRGEREVVEELVKRGIDSEKVPLSGAVGGDFAGDVKVSGEQVAEVKRRKNGFKELYKWLEDHDVVFLRADRKRWLVCMDIDEYVRLKRQERR